MQGGVDVKSALLVNGLLLNFPYNMKSADVSRSTGSSYLTVNIRGQDPFDGSKDPQVFLYSEDIKDDVELGAYTNQLFHLGPLCDLGHWRAIDGCCAYA